MLGPLMLMTALSDGVLLVTLGTLVLGATHTTLLVIPQHKPHCQHLVTVPTGKLLPSVHIHVFPEVIQCLEGQMADGTLGILPTNGGNLIRNLWCVP